MYCLYLGLPLLSILLEWAESPAYIHGWGSNFQSTDYCSQSAARRSPHRKLRRWSVSCILLNSISPSRRLLKRLTDRLLGSKLAQERLGLKAVEVCPVLHCEAAQLILCPGYGSLIRVYVQFILAKLRFHRLRPEFNGLFEYEEYISLKGIDDPNEGYVMALIICIFSCSLWPAGMKLSQISWVYRIR